MYLKDLFDAFSEGIKAKLTKLAKACSSLEEGDEGPYWCNWPNKFVFTFFWSK